LPLLTIETVLLAGLGCAGVRILVVGSVPLEAMYASPVLFGMAFSGGLTLWCNFILMRNDHNAQSTCGHSVLAPCQLTSQIMWISMQSGAIGGTIISEVW